MKKNRISSILQDDGQKEKNQVIQDKEYGLSDLNWKDDGGSPHDPSMNDYLKGYQMNPYQFTQFAQKNILRKVEAGESLGSVAAVTNKSTNELYKLNGFSKDRVSTSTLLKADSYLIVDRVELNNEERQLIAAKEVQDITYTPENLAKEIITLWSQTDGPIQNFFDGFTMNKTDNKMKKDISDILNEWGYNIKPTFVQDTPIYAAKAKAYDNFIKMASTRHVPTILSKLSSVFSGSEALQKLTSELLATELDRKMSITAEEAGGFVDYYKQIYPDDYAMELVNIAFDNPKLNFADFKDLQISDESLEQMEKMDSGNQKPTSDKPNNGGMGGYDFTTQTRSEGPGGIAPSNYETGPYTRVSSLKKK